MEELNGALFLSELSYADSVEEACGGLERLHNNNNGGKKKAQQSGTKP